MNLIFSPRSCMKKKTNSNDSFLNSLSAVWIESSHHCVSAFSELNFFCLSFLFRLVLALFLWNLRLALVTGFFFILWLQKNLFYSPCVTVCMQPRQSLRFWPSFSFTQKLFRCVVTHQKHWFLLFVDASHFPAYLLQKS